MPAPCASLSDPSTATSSGEFNLLLEFGIPREMKTAAGEATRLAAALAERLVCWGWGSDRIGSGCDRVGPRHCEINIGSDSDHVRPAHREDGINSMAALVERLVCQ